MTGLEINSNNVTVDNAYLAGYADNGSANAMNLREFDVVKFATNELGIVLKKPSTGLLTIYTVATAERKQDSDDGTVKVCRYGADGNVASGKEKYRITGVRHYVNRVMAMKCFVTGDVTGDWDTVGAKQMTTDELKAAVKAKTGISDDDMFDIVFRNLDDDAIIKILGYKFDIVDQSDDLDDDYDDFDEDSIWD